MKLFLSSKITLILIFFVAINIYPLATENANAEEKGCRYLFDKGDNKSYTKCLETACDKGIFRACGDLGFAYALRNTSSGNDKYKHGVQLLKNSCDRKDAMSCTALGFLYSNNQKDLDIDKGFEYSYQGCLLDLQASCDTYIHMFLSFPAHLVKLDLKKYKLKQNVYKNIYELTKKKCEQGVKGRRYCEGLGLLYINGDYVKKDMVKAVDIFRRGCDLEEHNSCYKLFLLHKDGLLVDKNSELAKKYEALAYKYNEVYKNISFFGYF